MDYFNISEIKQTFKDNYVEVSTHDKDITIKINEESLKLGDGASTLTFLAKAGLGTVPIHVKALDGQVKVMYLSRNEIERYRGIVDVISPQQKANASTVRTLNHDFRRLERRALQIDKEAELLEEQRFIAGLREKYPDKEQLSDAFLENMLKSQREQLNQVSNRDELTFLRMNRGPERKLIELALEKGVPAKRASPEQTAQVGRMIAVGEGIIDQTDLTKEEVLLLKEQLGNWSKGLVESGDSPKNIQKWVEFLNSVIVLVRLMREGEIKGINLAVSPQELEKWIPHTPFLAHLVDLKKNGSIDAINMTEIQLRDLILSQSGQENAIETIKRAKSADHVVVKDMLIEDILEEERKYDYPEPMKSEWYRSLEMDLNITQTTKGILTYQQQIKNHRVFMKELSGHFLENNLPQMLVNTIPITPKDLIAITKSDWNQGTESPEKRKVLLKIIGMFESELLKQKLAPGTKMAWRTDFIKSLTYVFELEGLKKVTNRQDLQEYIAFMKPFYEMRQNGERNAPATINILPHQLKELNSKTRFLKDLILLTRIGNVSSLQNIITNLETYDLSVTTFLAKYPKSGINEPALFPQYFYMMSKGWVANVEEFMQFKKLPGFNPGDEYYYPISKQLESAGFSVASGDANIRRVIKLIPHWMRLAKLDNAGFKKQLELWEGEIQKIDNKLTSFNEKMKPENLEPVLQQVTEVTKQSGELENILRTTNQALRTMRKELGQTKEGQFKTILQEEINNTEKGKTELKEKIKLAKTTREKLLSSINSLAKYQALFKTKIGEKRRGIIIEEALARPEELNKAKKMHESKLPRDMREMADEEVAYKEKKLEFSVQDLSRLIFTHLVRYRLYEKHKGLIDRELPNVAKTEKVFFREQQPSDVEKIPRRNANTYKAPPRGSDVDWIT